jgi:hypothetical protein
MNFARNVDSGNPEYASKFNEEYKLDESEEGKDDQPRILLDNIDQESEYNEDPLALDDSSK